MIWKFLGDLETLGYTVSRWENFCTTLSEWVRYGIYGLGTCETFCFCVEENIPIPSLLQFIIYASVDTWTDIIDCCFKHLRFCHRIRTNKLCGEAYIIYPDTSLLTFNNTTQGLKKRSTKL